MNSPPVDVTPLILVLAFGAVVILTARRRATWPVRIALAVGAGFWIALAGSAMWTVSQATAAATLPPVAGTPVNPCASGAPTKTFNVSLINLPIFLNRFGDVVPEGRMYILDANIATVRANFKSAADPSKANIDDLIEPLTLRVNKGDCASIRFTNRLNEAAPQLNRTVRDSAIFTKPGEIKKAAGASTLGAREFAPALSVPQIDFDPAKAPNASMHFDGLDYDVKTGDGTVVGNNPDSTAAPGAAITYLLYAQAEGEYQFKDGADFTSQQTRPEDANGDVRFIGSHSFGAFGAIVVEAADATWVHSNTGGAIASGTRAIIKRPNNKDFREHVLFMHDEVEAEPGILTRYCRNDSDEEDPSGDECVEPTAAQLAVLKQGTLPGLGGGDADAIVQYHEQVPVKLEWFAFNYRAEPTFNREEIGCPAATAAAQGFAANECVGEETSLSSWVYGDPGGGDLVFPNYRGEPAQVRLLHPAEFETHTFHWHVNRWEFDPQDEGGLDAISSPNHVTRTTNILDVQSVSPGTSYDLVVQGGAGSAHKDKKATFGDIIFHCHLYPHFANGMWGLNRTLDKLEDGTRTNPDGTPIPRLQPLADFDYQPGTGTAADPPPSPTATTPGFPLFVPGAFGFKAPKPPLAVSSRSATGAFPPTTKEKAAADAGAQVAGGFFQNPCPSGRPVKTFNISAIQLAQTYNPELQWKNPQARVYVLDSDRDAVLAGTKKPEPFSPLLTVGDCVIYNLTNRLPITYGGTVFDRTQTTNEVGLHQHMVQFDVLSSDGAANGWNYDQGADGAASGVGQTFTYRNFVHENTSTNSFHDHFFPNVHQDAGLFGGGTIHDAGCTFHDTKTNAVVTVGTMVSVHCDAVQDYTGVTTSGSDYRNVSLFIEDHVPMFKPADPTTTNDDQFVTPNGVPIFPAKFPSSNDDFGVMGINYRLEPFEARRDVDPSKVFSEEAGVPNTPIPLAFPGDRIKWRLFQLSQEESHGLNLDGRWRHEPKDPGSNIVSAQHIGMLEYFEMNVKAVKEGKKYATPVDRDELYYFGGSDDMFLGAWGYVRVMRCMYDGPYLGDTPEGPPPRIPNMYPLPDNTANALNCVGEWENPPRPGDTSWSRPPGTPCEPGADVKSFSVVAINRDITYNTDGDHDPNGLQYALEEDWANNTVKNEPLVIRANEGDCVEVTLKNKVDPAKMKESCFEGIEPGQLGYRTSVLSFPGCVDEPPKNEANVPGFRPLPVSNRVSIRPQLTSHWSYSSGTNVGESANGSGSFYDRTVGPGEQITYRWSLYGISGMAMLRDMADPMHHAAHGLYGALIVEPEGSTYLNPATGAALTSGTSAVIANPAVPDYRENIVLMNSDLALFRKDTNNNVADDQPVPDNLNLVIPPGREADDPEDQGEFSINYTNEPWSHRYADDKNITNIFSTYVHGDPATPKFQAYGGDKTVFHVGQAVGDPRSTSFALHDHLWRRAPNDAESQLAASQGQFNPGVSYEIVLDPAVTGGAGGRRAAAGDYLYRSGTLARHLTGGQWGIFRVHTTAQTGLIKLPDRPAPAQARK